MVEAVVIPVTVKPVLRMTPAPRKPTPVTICAEIRPGSTVAGAPAMNCQDRIEARVNSAEPAQMKMLVLRPAGLAAHSLSSPTRAPLTVATNNLLRALCSSRMKYSPPKNIQNHSLNIREHSPSHPKMGAMHVLTNTLKTSINTSSTFPMIIPLLVDPPCRYHGLARSKDKLYRCPYCLR